MRTRIALVAAVPVTLIVATTAPLAHAAASPGVRSSIHPSSQLTALRTIGLAHGAVVPGAILPFVVGPATPSSPQHHAGGTSTPPGAIALADMTVPLATTNATATAATATAATTAAATAATTAPPAPPPAPAPAPPPVTDATSTDTPDWACIRLHESGDRYNSPSAPSGAYGIIQVTWYSFGYSGWPYEASSAVQDAVALKLYNEYGWQPWSTRTVCGL